MNNINNNVTLSKIPESKWYSSVIDYIVLSILGIACYLYSIFGSDFAESNVQLSFLNFPIFIGEILLIICLILLLIKWKVVSLRFTRFHYLLLVYCGLFIFKTFYGYFNWGPLALRHAALFYYPFFAVIGYYFYNESFFRSYKMRSILLMILIVTAFRMPGDTLPLFLFTYWMLILVLALGYNSKFIKYLALSILVLLLFFRFKIIYQTNRSCLVSSLISILTCFLLMLSTLKLKIRFKIAIALLFFAFLNIGIIFFANRNVSKSLVSLREIDKRYKDEASYVYQNEKTFKMAETPLKLFHPNQGEYPCKELEISTKKLSNERKIGSFSAVSTDEKDTAAKTVAAEKKERSREEKSVISTEAPNISFSSPLITEQDSKAEPSSSFQDRESRGMLNSKLTSFKAMKLSLKRSVTRDRGLDNELGNITFRLLIWRDMIVELIKQKSIFGFDFGKPLRSKSIEILNYAKSEWMRDGWITPHNSYLGIIYYTGAIGLILIFTLFYVLIKILKIFLVHKSYTGIMLSSTLIYWLIIANFLVILELPYWSIPFWALFGMTIRVANNLIYKT